jgi:hypothetical protein
MERSSPTNTLLRSDGTRDALRHVLHGRGQLQGLVVSLHAARCSGRLRRKGGRTLKMLASPGTMNYLPAVIRAALSVQRTKN